MNYQLCGKLRSLCLLGKPSLSQLPSRRFIHASRPLLATSTPKTTPTSSSSTSTTPTPTPTTTSTTTSADLFRQTLKDVKAKEPAKGNAKNKGKKEEPGVRRATCTIKDQKGSPYKIALILNQVRGLSYQEAVAQMTFSKKRMAREVKRALDSARYNAENIHNMNPDRLLVENCWVCKGRYLKRLKIHARGKHGIMMRPYHHITVVLREVPYVSGERRLGRFGRTNAALRRQLGLPEEEDSRTVDVTAQIGATKKREIEKSN